jgi:hypothetical protein
VRVSKSQQEERDHLPSSLGPDAARVRRELAERAAEAEVARSRNGWKKVRLEDHRSREILEWLKENGSGTPIQLAHGLLEPWSLLRIYVRALERFGRVRVAITVAKHGHKRTTVSLVNEAP